MSTELPKTYDPASVEPQAYNVWLKEGAFHPAPSDSGKPYSIVIPPPNVTGALHLGHAINNTLQDILTRVHRMRGFNALWIPGIDHAGIATQAVVEKQLKEQENKTRHDVGREGLVERIWKWKEQYGDRIISQLKRLGCSCDWDRTRFTLDEMCARAVRETFFKLFKDGLIYRGKRLVNWDIHLQTSISDDEIYHETVKTNLWHIKYPIVNTPSPHGTPGGEGRGEGPSSSSPSATGPSPQPSPPDTGERGHDSRATHMVVATTRPETMLGDTAVAVHSQDPRWNWAIGKSVQLPLTERLIPIIADDILVDPKFGTGVVKVTPAHDPNDYAVWQRHQGKPDQIDIINILNPDGTLNENAGAYKGMKRDAARKKVVEDLGDLLLKEEPYETQVGHSDRSKTAVEPYLSDQWFVKMAPLAEPALEVVRNGTIKFYPERHAQQYLSWLGEKRDWPISRQLWWGHRIPVWTVTLDARQLEPGQDFRQHFKEENKRAEEVKKLVGDYLTACGIDVGNDLFIALFDGPVEYEIRLSVRTAQAADALSAYKEMSESFEFKKVVPGVEIKPAFNQVPRFANATNAYFALSKHVFSIDQDPDVLDTWFSSALWPHSTLGWPEQTDALKKWYPTSALLTGRDIITLWVARMVMTGLYNMKDVPFHHVAINPTILDEYGRRMSKSAGNGVDPVDIIESSGADALRFTLTHMATETQDARMPVKIVCPKCQTLIANPESNKIPTVKCPKCSTVVTRPLGTQTGSADAPLGRMTSEKFDLGRNFCNKLWNAARFVLSSLSPLPPGEGRGEGASDKGGSELSLADRWIISRFNSTIKEANDALSAYRFDQYARACYDFFWRDFCDWYVEASKPAMKDPKRSATTSQVLAAVLDGTLRLLHPMIPFITETIWWRLNEVRPQRGIPGLLECPPSERLIKAAWPNAGPVDEAGAEHVFPRLQDVIGAIRNLRNEHKVDQKRIVTVHIAPPEPMAVQVTNENRELIEVLSLCTIRTVQQNLPPPPNTVRATVNNACDVYVEDLVDANAEAARKGKLREELTKQIATLEARMSNESYISKAPPKLVEETKKKLAELQAELKKLD